MIFIAGAQGSGKSYAASVLCSYVDPSFDIDRVCFEAKAFRQRLEGLKRGGAIMMDEVGADLYKREWYKKEHTKINKILMTVRFQNNLILMTAPTFGSVDSGVRKNFNYYINMTDVDLARQMSYGRISEIWVNRFEDAMGLKPVWTTEGGGLGQINKIFFPRPEDAFVDAYEQKAETFKKYILSEGYYQKAETLREKRALDKQERKDAEKERFQGRDAQVKEVQQQILGNPQKFIRFDNLRGGKPFRIPPESLVYDLDLSMGKLSTREARYIITRLLDDKDFVETVKKERGKA